MKSFKSVDDYIADAPKEVQPKLEELRAIIKSAAPQIEEGMGYGMPSYKYKGPVIYFGVWKTHIGLYALPANIEEHQKDLEGYVTSKGTIQLPLDKKLPTPLIKKLVLANIKKNESKKS